MNYCELVVEEAMLNVDKSLLLLEAQIELDKIDSIMFEEGEKKKDGLINKVVEAIKNLIEKIKEVFLGKNEVEVEVSSEEKDEITKRNKIIKMLKSNIGNKKLWAALAATAAVGVVAGNKVRKNHIANRNRRMKFEAATMKDFNDIVDKLIAAQARGDITAEQFEQRVDMLRKTLHKNFKIIKRSKSRDPELEKYRGTIPYNANTKNMKRSSIKSVRSGQKSNHILQKMS